MMPEAKTLEIELSEIDQMRFGYRTARAVYVTADTVPDVLAFCLDHRVRLLIARCSASDMQATHALERAGCLLMDTLVYYTRNLRDAPLPDDARRFEIRPLQAGEEDVVTQVADETFRGYGISHYHADPRLDPIACDAVYTSWVRALCLPRSQTSEMLIATEGKDILGFAAVRLNNPSEGEGVLFGVSPAGRGRGIYTSLIIEGLNWSAEKGATRCVVSTQLNNWQVQHVWARAGMKIATAYYTFHKWFE